MADLAAYPLYVGFTEDSISAESKEALMELGAEKIFTQELLDAVAGADLTGLTPSMAGFVLSADGKPNITFGIWDGRLAVGGINY